MSHIAILRAMEHVLVFQLTITTYFENWFQTTFSKVIISTQILEDEFCEKIEFILEAD